MRPQCNLLLPDVHAPFHNKRLLPRVLKLAHDIRPDKLVITGDFGDFHSVSRHNKGSVWHLKDLTLGKEYEAQNRLLDDIDAAIGRRCEKEFIEGNHESNVLRWLQDEDNAKVGGALDMPVEALRMRERGYTYHENWKEASVALGTHLEAVHGEYCTTHAAKKHLDEYEGSVVFGHTHRFQSFVTGKRGAWNIGWLGDRDNPAFGYATASQRRRWVNGFAICYVLDDGSFRMCPVQCWDSRFVWAGKLY